MDPKTDRSPESLDELSERFRALESQAQAVHREAVECSDPRRAEALYQRHAELLREMMRISQGRVERSQEVMRRMQR